MRFASNRSRRQHAQIPSGQQTAARDGVDLNRLNAVEPSETNRDRLNTQLLSHEPSNRIETHTELESTDSNSHSSATTGADSVSSSESKFVGRALSTLPPIIAEGADDGDDDVWGQVFFTLYTYASNIAEVIVDGNYPGLSDYDNKDCWTVQ
ncbi:hypothetical protein ACHAWF_011278 [Thalassiosira exigua]